MVATDTEVAALIKRGRLFGRGLGHVAVHLVASALPTPDARLWRRDRRLAEAARRLGVAPT